MTRLLRHREVMLALGIVLLVVLVAMRFPAFAAPGNLLRVFNDTAILMMLAIGQMTVILTRCIDLSVAANLALTGMVVALVNVAAPGLPMPVLIAISLGFGFLLGAFNGFLVWKVGIPAIVATLGTMAIFRGLIYVLNGGAWVNSFQMSREFIALPRTVILGLPVLGWIAIAVLFAALFLIRNTRSGRAFYAVGGNPTAAVYTGLDVGFTQFKAFCISGTIAGLCGYLWVSRYAVAYVDVATAFELDVVAACVIGGISIAGGIGTVAGAALGALFLGVIKNALPVINVSPFWQMAITGTVIILAVAFNARAERRKGRIILKSARAAA